MNFVFELKGSELDREEHIAYRGFDSGERCGICIPLFQIRSDRSKRHTVDAARRKNIQNTDKNKTYKIKEKGGFL